MARLGIGEPLGLEPEPGSGTTRKTIYALGGSQHSLRLKYRIVASIRKEGLDEAVLVAPLSEDPRPLGSVVPEKRESGTVAGTEGGIATITVE
jgi:hypothetical protein